MVKRGRLECEDFPGDSRKENRATLESHVRVRWTLQLGKEIRRYRRGQYILVTPEGETLPVPFMNPSSMRVEQLKLAMGSILKLVTEEKEEY